MPRQETVALLDSDSDRQFRRDRGGSARLARPKGQAHRSRFRDARHSKHSPSATSVRPSASRRYRTRPAVLFAVLFGHCGTSVLYASGDGAPAIRAGNQRSGWARAGPAVPPDRTLVRGGQAS